MPTVINDLLLEPAAPPTAQEAKTASAGGGGSQGTAPPSPDIARQVKHVERLCHERSLRLWAH